MDEVEEGAIPREFIEFDFAEDALDFEVSNSLSALRLSVQYLLILHR